MIVDIFAFLTALDGGHYTMGTMIFIGAVYILSKSNIFSKIMGLYSTKSYTDGKQDGSLRNLWGMIDKIFDEIGDVQTALAKHEGGCAEHWKNNDEAMGDVKNIMKEIKEELQELKRVQVQVVNNQKKKS